MVALGVALAVTGAGGTAVAHYDPFGPPNAHAQGGSDRPGGRTRGARRVRRDAKAVRGNDLTPPKVELTRVGSARKVSSSSPPPQQPVDPSSVQTSAPASTPAGDSFLEPAPTSSPDPESTSPPALEPTPSPAPGSEAVQEGLLFNGTRIKDFWLLQAAPDAITEAPDPAGSEKTVLDFTVKNSDVYPITPSENPRAQALSPLIIEPGMEFWTSFKFFLPENFPETFGTPTVWNGKWVLLYGVYGRPFAGSSPFAISVRPFKGQGLGIGWQRNKTYGVDNPWVMPMKKNQWITVLTHERFGTDGWVEMWVNGQQITFFEPGGFDYYNPNHEAPTQRLEMKTMDSSNDESSNYVKISNYREVEMFESGSVYFDGLKVGETRASVGG
jgi:hypothetical protein